MSGIPETDAEVKAYLDDYSDTQLRTLLWKIYVYQRQIGSSVLDAWVETLRTHIEAASLADDAIARAEGKR